VCRQIEGALASGSDAHLLCAGTRGEITGEDVLFAGAVASRMSARGLAADDENKTLLNDQAHVAAMAWQTLVSDNETSSAAALGNHLAKHTRGGRNVTALGLAGDILAAATIDHFDFTPELQLDEWRITR